MYPKHINRKYKHDIITNPCVVEAVTKTTMTVAAGKNSSTPDLVT